MDVRMPLMDGLEATRRILENRSDGAPRILMLTTFDLDEYVYEALRAGASGFLLKDAPADELVHAVRVVAAGDALVAPSVMRRLIADFIRQPRTAKDEPVALHALTPREREVLTLVARGLSNAEISATLVVAPQTTKTHIGRILRKLQLRDRETRGRKGDLRQCRACQSRPRDHRDERARGPQSQWRESPRRSGP